MSITLTAIPGGKTSTRIPLDEIPKDVISAVEDAYLYNVENPAERLQAGFATQEAADEFLKQARAYAYQRKAGRLVVSGNTTKKGYARFRVADYEGPAEEAEEAEEAETE